MVAVLVLARVQVQVQVQVQAQTRVKREIRKLIRKERASKRLLSGLFPPLPSSSGHRKARMLCEMSPYPDLFNFLEKRDAW